MILARVRGNATSTVCHPSFKGVRLLLCEVLDAAGGASGKVLLCGDWQGAGAGDKVLVTSDGEAASRHTGDKHMPMRNVVIAIIDEDDESEGAR